MRYYFDTEFIERPCTIDLISIGIVSQDNRELYLESSEVDRGEFDEWLLANVAPHLQGRGVPRPTIRDAIIDFIGNDPRPQFWAYFADYDWVVFCWLFGRMVDLPPHFPRYCRDFKQYMDEHGIKRSQLPEKPASAHNALSDAQWLKRAYETATLL